MHACQQHTICISNAIEEAEAFCSSQQLRFTGLRKKILELIWASHRPIKAYDLLDQLSAIDKSAKPPTVYRTLDFLLEHRFIHRINSLNAFIGCTHPHQHTSCSFLICTQCLEAQELCSSELHTTLQQLSQRHNFFPQHISIEISGLCHACQPENPQ